MELQLQQVDLKWNAEKFAPTPFKRASQQALLKERNTAMESFTFFYLKVKKKQQPPKPLHKLGQQKNGTRWKDAHTPPTKDN